MPDLSICFYLLMVCLLVSQVFNRQKRGRDRTPQKTYCYRFPNKGSIPITVTGNSVNKLIVTKAGKFVNAFLFGATIVAL